MPFPAAESRGGRKLRPKPFGSAGLVHGAKLIWFLIFCKKLSVEPFAFGRFNRMQSPAAQGDAVQALYSSSDTDDRWTISSLTDVVEAAKKTVAAAGVATPARA